MDDRTQSITTEIGAVGGGGASQKGNIDATELTVMTDDRMRRIIAWCENNNTPVPTCLPLRLAAEWPNELPLTFDPNVREFPALMEFYERTRPADLQAALCVTSGDPGRVANTQGRQSKVGYLGKKSDGMCLLLGL